MVCCLVAVFSGCEEDDDYRGYMLSGRWFGNLGMMVDGQPAIGSDLEFIPQDYGGYTQGYGYETDYYYGWRGRVEIVEHYFTWTVRDGIIYLRFDINPAKRNVLDLKNETCKNREKRNVLKKSHTRHFKAIKKQSRTGCFYSF